MMLFKVCCNVTIEWAYSLVTLQLTHPGIQATRASKYVQVCVGGHIIIINT